MRSGCRSILVTEGIISTAGQAMSAMLVSNPGAAHSRKSTDLAYLEPLLYELYPPLLL